MNYGIIDIGSNTIRIVVYRISEGQFECIFNEKYFVQLIGYIKNGEISEEGVRKLVQSILRLQEAVRYFHVKKLFCFATAPFRAVESAKALVDLVEKYTGIEVSVLSGVEEARLGVIGAQFKSAKADGIFADLGGGSMEISLVRNGRVEEAASLDVGCVALADKYVSGILPAKREIQEIKKCVEGVLDRAPWLNKAQGLDMVLIGGTARAMGQIHRTLAGENTRLDAYRFPAKDMKDVYKKVAEMGTDGVRLLTNTCPGRIFTFVPGAVALYRLSKKCGAADVYFSTYGVREGYLIEHVLHSPEDASAAQTEETRAGKTEAV